MGVSQIEIGSSAAKKVPRATQAIGKQLNSNYRYELYKPA